MNRLAGLLTVARARLRLDLMNSPSLLGSNDIMAMPKFAGLSDALDKLEHGLEFQAEKMHGRIATAGERGEAAIKKLGDQKVGVIEKRIAEVETFIAKVEGSNGSPISGDSSQQSPEASASADVEQLTVNGVSGA